jgi:hypothetical protein
MKFGQHCPLIQDLQKQRSALKRFAWKGLLLVLLFLGFDRLVGFLLTGGISRYYGLDQPCDILCIGHSQTVLGVDKLELERRLGMRVAKYAVEGANTADRFVMLRHYLSVQPKSVRALLIGVDARTFADRGLSSASYTLLYPYVDDPNVGAYVKANCKSSFEYVLRRFLMTPRFGEMPLSLAFRGYTGNWSNMKYGQLDSLKLKAEITQGRFRRIGFDQENLRLFHDMVRYARDRDIRVILVYVPTVDILNSAEPEKQRRAISIFQSYAAADAGVTFLNYNLGFENRHELFFDSIHLNPRGRDVVTDRLAVDLTRLLGNNHAGLAEPRTTKAGS